MPPGRCAWCQIPDRWDSLVWWHGARADGKVTVVSFLTRAAFVATLVWAVVMGGVVPGGVAWLVYGRMAGVLAGLVGGALGYLIHRYAWADVPPAKL